MFNFENAEVRKEKFNREVSGIPRGQSFVFKYRPLVSKKGKKEAEAEGKDFEGVLSHQFELSNDKFKELGIANKAVAWLLDKDEDGKIVGVALVVTEEGDENANTYTGRKTGEKMCSFTHENIQRDLGEAGVIDVPADKDDELVGVNQLLDLVYQADIESMSPGKDGYVPVEKDEGLAVYAVVRADAPVEGEDEIDPEE